ncbi:hypothetical protein BU26DRAFT_519552 [Trematosphaeria pertusa]|uniref:Uncharacterized protein n=1 Tax=Trematosphaeria pertusa TaxID=390896 RepID=A0A6A6IH68_9PLEO|nr:uncharacterized protein BU26DRAFT_519552 [Trematosphaeria pertusa]KAF2249507.1 hypothetical protein BU26DRAFT_519552 [Trematosphaeria pertusa]
MVYRANDWDALPKTGDGVQAADFDPPPDWGFGSGGDDYPPWEICDDEHLALQLLQAELDNPSLPYTVNLVKTVCVGSWWGLPLEIKIKILAYLLEVPHQITADDVDSGGSGRKRHRQTRLTPRDWLGYDLTRYKLVSKEFRGVVQQVFYQKNEFVLQPGRETKDIIILPYLSLFYPVLSVNHFIKRLDFKPPEELMNHEYERFQYLAGGPKLVDDTWQFLKNIALGKYGFPLLERIRVFFLPDSARMQVFWNWKIKVKTVDGYKLFLPVDAHWQQELDLELAVRPIGLTCSDQPGFELIRRETADKVGLADAH